MKKKNKLDDLVKEIEDIFNEEAETGLEFNGYQDYDVTVFGLSKLGKKRIKQLLKENGAE